jgi:hypothetical protein
MHLDRNPTPASLVNRVLSPARSVALEGHNKVGLKVKHGSVSPDARALTCSPQGRDFSPVQIR